MKLLKILFLFPILFLVSGFIYNLYYHVPLFQSIIIFILYSLGTYSVLTFRETAKIKNKEKRWLLLFVSFITLLLVQEMLNFLLKYG